MEFKPIINYLMAGNKLDADQAYQLMNAMGAGQFNEAQYAAIIISISSRDLGMEEIKGFRKALFELSLPCGLEEYDSIDLCGTGGDGKNTFNISTLSSFIVAGAGYKVAKHGNYGVSSLSGSSNVMEQMGYTFSNDSGQLQKEIEEIGMTFLHAPLFHPALRHVGPVRKQLGIKTVFNVLGPLVNPAKTPKQLVGVFNLKLARLYHFVLQEEGKRYRVLHSLDGYDEVSLTSNTMTYSSLGEELFEPEDFGHKTITQDKLYGGTTLKESTIIFKKILNGDGTPPQEAVVTINAALAIQCFEQDKSVAECQEIATESLASGKATQILKLLIA